MRRGLKQTISISVLILIHKCRIQTKRKWFELFSLLSPDSLMKREVIRQHVSSELVPVLRSGPAAGPGPALVLLSISGPFWQKRGARGQCRCHCECHSAGWAWKRSPGDEQCWGQVWPKLPQSGHEGCGHHTCTAQWRYWPMHGELATLLQKTTCSLILALKSIWLFHL